LPIHGGQVEIQLPGVLGLELGSLQLHDHIALEPRVIEQQVDEELLVAHL
jgi:hypothetical protein